MKTKTPTKLGKVKGFLCESLDGHSFFRVYNKRNGSFNDYKIAHCDLQIEINDKDAYVYKTKDGLMIDYSPTTLGIEENKPIKMKKEKDI